nr:IS3 family transposase [Clostridia bacterium]
MCSFKTEEFEIVELLSRDYDVKDLCSIMGVSRSGYYKWKKREPSERDLNRENMIAAVKAVHEEHPSHGYRWTAAFIRINMKVEISDNYAYKCFRYLGIKAQTKHKEHRRPRKERDKYPNLIFSTWETVDRPRQVIVSDMTAFKYWIFYFEVTFYFDVFTKEILSWRVAERRGSREQYIGGLVDVVDLLRGCKEPTIVHTDQGSVYASLAYNELIKDTNIVRSMSRAGKPTDNPVNEALNGWIKEELFIDFKIERCRTRDEFKDAIERYVRYYNEQRPCYAIGYDTPANYRKRYYKGELQRKNTFASRTLSEEPKFVQKRREKAHSETVSTSENENV